MVTETVAEVRRQGLEELAVRRTHRDELMQKYGVPSSRIKEEADFVGAYFRVPSVPPLVSGSIGSAEELKVLDQEMYSGRMSGKVDGFYDLNLDLAVTFQDKYSYGIMEPEVTSRLRVHELAHGVGSYKGKVRLCGEKRKPHDWLAYTDADTGQYVLCRPRLGLVVDNTTQESSWGHFLEEGISERAATEWVNVRLAAGKMPKTLAAYRRIVPEYDPNDSEDVMLSIVGASGIELEAPIYYFVLDKKGLLLETDALYAVTAVDLLIQAEPRIESQLIMAKRGELRGLRGVPKFVDGLLGRGAYAYLQKEGPGADDYPQKYAFVNSKLGYS